MCVVRILLAAVVHCCNMLLWSPLKCGSRFSNSFVYFGLALNAGNLGGSLYVASALSSLSDLPSLAIGAYLVDLPSMGRKITLSGADVHLVPALTRLVP